MAVRNLLDARSLSGSSGSICALLTTGSVECWGDDACGALGDGGHEAYSDVPVGVRGNTNAVSLSDNGASYRNTLVCTRVAAGPHSSRIRNGVGRGPSPAIVRATIEITYVVPGTRFFSPVGGTVELIGMGG